MKYTPIIFAKAFYEVLVKTPKEEHNLLCKRFALILEKYGAIKDSSKILRAIKKIVAAKEGISIIEIETARELDYKLTDKVKTLFKKTSDFTMKVNKDLIAGIKITIDDEISIDNSLRRRLKCMK